MMRAWFGGTRGRGFAIGIAATAGVLLLHLSGGLGDFEDWAYDQRMRHFNTLGESDRIVHIDLTDQTFDLIGSWPWPRRLTGDLIRTLAELGAEYIALDIEFKRPRDPRRTAFEIIDDDRELASAIREAGNVFVPVSFKTLPPGVSLASARTAARAILRDDPNVTQERFGYRLGENDIFGASGLLRFRVGELLRTELGQSAEVLASKTGVPVNRIGDILPGLKLAVARELVSERLETHPQTTREELVAEICAGTEECDPGDRRDIERAEKWFRARRAVTVLSGHISGGGLGRLPEAIELRPAIEQVGSAACGTGFVAFEGEGNVVRHTALVVRYGERTILQLGLAVACRMAGIEDRDIRMTREGVLEMPNPADPGGMLRVRLDERGRALINWSAGSSRSEAVSDAAWLRSFRHIPAARIMEIPFFRREIEHNRLSFEALKQRVVERFDQTSSGVYAESMEEFRRLGRSERNEKAAELRAELKATMEEIETRAFAKLAYWWEEIQGVKPESDEDRTDYELIELAYADIIEGGFDLRIRGIEDRYGAMISKRQAELQPLIEGKTCIIGYTASAVADMKPTPVYDIAPGAMIYSNIINQVLAGRMPRHASAWTNATLTVIAGLVVAWLAATTPAVTSVLIMLALILAYVGVNAGFIYRRYDIFLALIAPVVCMATVWALVTVYRQLTEERQRRRFSRALAQYVSPAVANQLAKRSDRLDMTPVAREITCLFSDLKGFTTLSERLGAERTRAVLNPYLEAMSRVLHERGALINKFMGDGIFAFFNAPILDCSDHAERACEAALDSFTALAELQANPPAGAPREEMARLSMRVGMATGTVFVGDYGSDTKLDYTAIGDSINLGARLEPANKVFGTRIALSEGTRKLAGDRFVFRRLGLIQVMGKTQGVQVYELVGKRDGVRGTALEYVGRFEEALAAFFGRDFRAARLAFERCIEERPDDHCARRYLEKAGELEATPPGEDWLGTLQLTSK